MLIENMSLQDSTNVLIRARFGRLACVNDGQPYITPIYFAYHDSSLYSFSAVGQKIHWMRSNPLVCAEVEEISNQQSWSTVIIFGKYEELLDTPEHGAKRQRAYDLLQKRPMWWEPASAPLVHAEAVNPSDLVYFRIIIDRVSGRRGLPETGSAETKSSPETMLHRLIAKLSGKR